MLLVSKTFKLKTDCLVYRFGFIFYISCIFIILFSGCFVQTFLKKSNDVILVFSSTFGMNEVNFCKTCSFGLCTWVNLLFYLKLLFVYFLLYMNSSRLCVPLNLMRYFVQLLPAFAKGILQSNFDNKEISGKRAVDSVDINNY